MGVLSDNAFKSETHYELMLWGRWARGNSIRPWQMNVLARLMQQKMEDMSSGGTTIDGFPLYVEVIDRSVAQLKIENRNEYKTVMRYYLAGDTHDEIAHYLRKDPDYIRELHVRAIHAIDRIKRNVRRRLTGKA